MSTQAEALRLADQIHTGDGQWMQQAAAELRRLHSVNAELLDALKNRAEVDSAYMQLAVMDIDGDMYDRLLEQIDDAEYRAKALSRVAIAKATGENHEVQIQRWF
jgi:hypothetical protein